MKIGLQYWPLKGKFGLLVLGPLRNDADTVAPVMKIELQNGAKLAFDGNFLEPSNEIFTVF